MIVLHKPTETNFNKNGKAILKGAILRGVLTHKINGACMITIEMLKGNPKTDLVDKEDIITCPTPFGMQPFRVFDINPLGLDRVEIVARHVFFDLQKRVVKRCKIDNSNGQFILDKFLVNLDKAVPHKLYSNLRELVSLDWQLKQGVDILLGDDENSFVKKFGKGELRVDGYNAWIDERIGRNRGFKAKFRKNITGFSGKTSTDGLLTRIIPKGFDGITLPNDGYVDSPLVGKYADIYTKVVDFPDVKWKDSPNNSSKEGFDTLEQAQAELTRVALAYFTDTECDIIKASFNINLIMLKDTLEYKDVAVSEEVQLGDTITVDYSPYNIAMEKRLVGYTYNILSEKMETLEVGDFGLDYFRSVSDKINKLPDVEQILGKLETDFDIDGKLEEFTDNLLNGGNGSYVKFIPNFQNPREILVLDSEVEANAKKVIRINKEGIGVSTTGVTGQYYGLVVNGKLVVSEATATKIVASLIQGGMLASKDNSSYINLDNGEFNFKDKISFLNGVFNITLSSGETLEDAISKTAVSLDVMYYLSTSSTELVGGSWQTTAPQWAEGKYMWSKTVTTFNDGTTRDSEPTCISGASGMDGKGIKSIVEEYYLSTSNTTQTGGGWVSKPPTWANGKYMWTRSVTTYTDGTTSTTDPVCVSGSKGDKGENGVGIETVDVEYYLSTSASTPTGGSWSTTAPTWVDGKYIWSRTKTVTSNGKTSYTDPVCITGGKGSTGSVGQGVESITEEYYLSTSKTAQTGGSWTTTPPTWSIGKYMWTRSKIVYKNPANTEYTVPICDSSWEAVNELEIGGRNLVLNSNDEKTYGKDTLVIVSKTNNFIKVLKNTSNTDSNLGVWKDIIVEPNTEYTVSFRVGYSDNGRLGIGSFISGNNIWSGYGYFNFTSNKLFTKTFTTKNGETKIRLFVALGNTAPINSYLEFINLKLEKGNKATDWTPAPEDIESAIAEVKEEVTTTNKKVSSIETTMDDINLSVESLETTTTKRTRVGSFRYVRDWLRGSTANGGNHWVELKVMVGETNIAQGKTPTSNYAITNGSNYTNGQVNNSYTGSSAPDGTWAYLQIDLGSVREDIDSLQVWHYYSDGRSYTHRLEVSRDGVTWYTLYDSEVMGRYKETDKGRFYLINESSTETRLKSAESKITSDAIVNTVKNHQTNGKNTFAQSSEVEQTVNSWVAKFGSSGGSNLIMNSQVGIASSDYGFGNRIVDMTLLQKGKKYTLTVNGRVVNGAGNRYLMVFIFNGDWTFNKSITIKETTDTTRSITFEVPSNMTGNLIVSSYHYPSDGDRSGSSRINWYCLTEGEIPSLWVPHHGEVINGKTQIDANGVTVFNGALMVKNNANQIVLNGDSDGNLWVQNTMTVGGNTNGAVFVKNSSGTPIFSANKNGTFVKDGTMKISSGNITTSGTGYPDGNTREMTVYSHGLDIAEVDYNGSQVSKRGANYQGGHLSITEDNTGNASGISYRVHQTPKKIALQKSGGGNLSFSDIIAMYGDTGIITGKQINFSSPTDLVNDAPWHGVGKLNMVWNGGTPVQFSGYYGARMRSANATLDVYNPYGAMLTYTNGYGNFEVGSLNSSYCHVSTDRGMFYFYKGIETEYNFVTNSTTTVGAFEGYRDGGKIRIVPADSRGAISFQSWNSSGTKVGEFLLETGLRPASNSGNNLGHSSYRWAEVWCTRGAFNGSDSKLKEDIKVINSFLARNELADNEIITTEDLYNYVKDTDSYTFKYKGTERDVIGILADEIPRNIFNKIGVMSKTEEEYNEEIKRQEELKEVLKSTPMPLDAEGKVNDALLIEGIGLTYGELKEEVEKEIEEPMQLINAPSQIALVQTVLSMSLKKIETLEEENRELKDRLSKIESLLGIK